MTTFPHRKLGALSAPAIGLGCMSLSGVYGDADDAASEALIRHALDIGVTHLDSSDVYGWGHNETRRRPGHQGPARARSCWQRNSATCANADGSQGINGQPRYVAQACEASLQASRRRGDRPLLPAPRRSAACRSRTRSAPWRGWCSRARCAISACRRRTRKRSAARMRCTRSPPCRPSFRCSIARRPRKRGRPRANSASASWPIRRWGAAS